MIAKAVKLTALLDLIGNTPMVQIQSITRHLPDNIRIHAKLERFNPGGSVKDRPALWMVRDGLEKGLLNKLIWFEKVLNSCIVDLTPHHLPTYLMELAGLFHSFYDKHKVVDEENPKTTQLRLFILRGVKFVINEGLNLIGVSAPEKM